MQDCALIPCVWNLATIKLIKKKIPFELYLCSRYSTIAIASSRTQQGNIFQNRCVNSICYHIMSVDGFRWLRMIESSPDTINDMTYTRTPLKVVAVTLELLVSVTVPPLSIKCGWYHWHLQQMRFQTAVQPPFDLPMLSPFWLPYNVSYC